MGPGPGPALRDRAGAFIALKYALRIDGSRARTHLGLGAVLFDTGHRDDALECFERARTLDPVLAAARSPSHP